jgi:hypothetical protein
MGLDHRLRRILAEHGAGLGRVAALAARGRAEEEDPRCLHRAREELRWQLGETT